MARGQGSEFLAAMALVCDRCGRRNRRPGEEGANPQVDNVPVLVNAEAGKFGMRAAFDLCAICRDSLINVIRGFCQEFVPEPEPKWEAGKEPE